MDVLFYKVIGKIRKELENSNLIVKWLFFSQITTHFHIPLSTSFLIYIAIIYVDQENKKNEPVRHENSRFFDFSFTQYLQK